MNPLFVYSGIGAEWFGMALGLFNEYSVFKSKILECDEALKPHTGWSLLPFYEKKRKVSSSEHGLPVLFSVQLALTDLLKKQFGIIPGGISAHSAGEFAAAVSAGQITLDDCSKLIGHVCRIVRETSGYGSMLYINSEKEKIEKIIEEKKISDKIYLSAENGITHYVYAGLSDNISALEKSCSEAGIFCRILNIDMPLHSPIAWPVIKNLKTEILNDIQNIKYSKSKYPFYSTVFPGKYDITSNEYWPDLCMKPVLFRQAFEYAIKDGYDVFIEIGSHSQLGDSIAEINKFHNKNNYIYTHTLKKNGRCVEEILRCVSTLGAKFTVTISIVEENIIKSLNIGEPAKTTEKKSDKFFNESKIKNYSQVEEIIIEEMNSLLKKDIRSEIIQGKSFFEIGITSIMAVTLAAKLSERTGKNIPVTHIFSFANASALAAEISGESIQKTQKKKETYSGGEPIAIIGMSCRLPGGANSIKEYWNLILAGEDCTSDIPKERFDVDDFYDSDRSKPGKTYATRGGFLKNYDIKSFDADHFKISPREARQLDPQQRMLMEVSWEAFENAGYNPLELKNKNIGVYIGICTDDYKQSNIYSPGMMHIEAYSLTGTSPSCSAGRISYFYGLTGPCIAMDTACSSSLTALNEAVAAIRSGQCEAAVVGGVNLVLSPNFMVYFSKLGAISPDGRCKSFDDSADGYSRGEGCGIIIIKPLSQAVKDGDAILALIKGTALNQDGPSNGLTAPNGAAQEAVIEAALENAGLKQEDIDYIEAHGTGTPLGDPIEANAIAAVMKARAKDDPIYISAVKSNIGHLEAASGIASIITII